jgi:two-component system cell cycle sensor histidine kinase/response regulator CckA
MDGLDDDLYRRLFDSAPDGLVVCHLVDRADDRSLLVIAANPAAATSGVSAAAIGRRLVDALPALASSLARCAEACRTGAGAPFRAGHLDVVPIALGGARVGLRITTARGPDAQRLSAFFDTVLEQLPAMVFVKDAVELRFTHFNRAGEELLELSRTALLGKNDHDLFPAAQADAFVDKDRQVLATGGVWDIPEEPILTPRGTRWLHTRKIPVRGPDGTISHLLGISMDITERKRAEDLMRASHQESLARTEEQLRQAQKMEAVGRLAGGVAHDFNNLLSVILGYAHLLQGQLDGDPRYGGDLREIRTAGERAASLTRQLLAFSRQQVLDPRVLDLSEVVRNLEPMLRRIVGEDVEITVGEHPVLGRIKADPGQLEQVLMNLVVNSRDAMPTGGKLTIELANVDLDGDYAAEHLGVTPGPHVMLAVSDTGFGMDRATAARIFEPFFTTKEKGKGTGLGLSTVFGIVQQSGGTIWVYSEPGAGATFKIYLPMTSDDAMLLREPERVGRLGGSETILLAEDEEQVRVMVATILRRQGYTVLEARDAMAAMHHARHHPAAIDLLLTDVVMPEVGGRSLAVQIAAVRPGLRVLYVSGYTDDAVVRHGVLEADVAFLQKPITPDALARKVREVLDGPGPPG